MPIIHMFYGNRIADYKFSTFWSQTQVELNTMFPPMKRNSGSAAAPPYLHARANIGQSAMYGCNIRLLGAYFTNWALNIISGSGRLLQ